MNETNIINTIECGSYEYFKRWWLVCSNIFFLLPIIYKFVFSFTKDAQIDNESNTIRCNSLFVNFINAFMDITLLSCTMVFSWIYHMCDALDVCTKICITNEYTLRDFDFTFAFNMFTIAGINFLDPNFTIFKIIMYPIMLIVNFTYAFSIRHKYPGDTNQLIYIMFSIVVIFLLIFIKFIWLCILGKLKDNYRKHFNIWLGILAIINTTIAVYFFFNSNNNVYWYYHSFWHIFIALAVFFEFEMYNPKLLCCKKDV